MNILDEDFNKAKFPYNESDKLEYKITFNDNAMQKYIEIICGFLNSGGGKLIFGIRDDLLIVGLNVGSKNIDNYILKIDEITRNKKIIGIDKLTNNPTNINPLCIKPNILINNIGKKFLIIDIIPEENIYYQLLNGKCYFRLGASNYFNRVEVFYTESEYKNKCDQYQKILQEENQNNINNFRKIIKNKDEELNNKDKEVNKLQTLNNQLTTENKEIINIYNKYIQNTIKYIGLKKISYYNYFKDYLFCCYPN
jgi:hypothetical protein